MQAMPITANVVRRTRHNSMWTCLSINRASFLWMLRFPSQIKLAALI